MSACGVAAAARLGCGDGPRLAPFRLGRARGAGGGRRLEGSALGSPACGLRVVRCRRFPAASARGRVARGGRSRASGLWAELQ